MRKPGLGIAAWIATALIATSWQVATRWGVTSSLTPMDLALLRYGIPALCLLPVLLNQGFWPRGMPVWIPVLIAAGGGLPFGLLGMAGAQFAPASHMGAVLPGSMPVFIALLSALVLGERFTAQRLLGLSFIVFGVTCIVALSLTADHLGSLVYLGDILFLTAGVCWAIYTIAYRKSGLDPWYCAGFICFWSSVFVVPLWLIAPGSQLFFAPVSDVFIQVFAQGILAGLLGLAVYGISIRHLGANLAGLSGAVVPGLTAVAGVVLLNEPLSRLTVLGICLVAIGIWIASGAAGLSCLRRRAWTLWRGKARGGQSQ